MDSVEHLTQQIEDTSILSAHGIFIPRLIMDQAAKEVQKLTKEFVSCRSNFMITVLNKAK